MQPIVVDPAELGDPQKQSHMRITGRVWLTQDAIYVRLVAIDVPRLHVEIGIGNNPPQRTWVTAADIHQVTENRFIRFDRIADGRVDFSAWSPDHITVQTRDQADMT